MYIASEVAASPGLTPALAPGLIPGLAPGLAELQALIRRLARYEADLPLPPAVSPPTASLSDAARVDLIAVLESVKSAAAAAQARLTAAFDASQRAVQAAAGVPLKRRGRGGGRAGGVGAAAVPEPG